MFEVKLLSDAIKKLNPSFSAADYLDKAHYIVTCGLLLFFGFVVCAKQIFGEPISCFVPPEFSGPWSTYVNSYCFVTGTHSFKSGRQHMVEDAEHMNADEMMDVKYYQWIPYLLILQAAMFYLPHLIWRLLQKTETDIPFKNVVDKCVDSRDMTVEGRDKKIKDVVDSLVKTHDFRQVKCNVKGLGTAGLAFYILYKLLNICNVLCQFYVFSWFFDDDSFSWGLQMLRNVLFKGVYSEYVFFPRVSYCTFPQNVLANKQERTIQCLLMMNMINDKIFVLLFGWFLVLLVASVVNLLFVIYYHVFRRGDTVARYLQGHGDGGSMDCKTFAKWNLGFDGVLLLRFVESNAGFMVAARLARDFYDALQGEVNGDLGIGKPKGKDSETAARKRIIGGVLQKAVDNEEEATAQVQVEEAPLLQ